MRLQQLKYFEGGEEPRVLVAVAPGRPHKLEEGHFSLSESATTYIQGGEARAKASQIEVAQKGTDCRGPRRNGSTDPLWR